MRESDFMVDVLHWIRRKKGWIIVLFVLWEDLGGC